MKAAERRESILDASEQTFARLGYRVATMADIANAAGITQPMLYRHFASKRDLFLAVIDRAMAHILAAWEQVPSLVEMGVAYVQLAAGRPDLVRLRLQALAECDDKEIQARYEELIRRQLALIRTAVARDVDAGRLRPDVTPEGITWLFTALGMLVDNFTAMQMAEAPEAIEQAAQLLWQQVLVTPHTGA